MSRVLHRFASVVHRPWTLAIVLSIAGAAAAASPGHAPADGARVSGIGEAPVAPATSHGMRMASGQLYVRQLFVERVYFRRDGDPFGGEGELRMQWSGEPVHFSGQHTQSGTVNDWSVRHAKKKCADTGCLTTYSSDCRWYQPHTLIWEDWFVEGNYCNPIDIELHFSEEDDVWDTRAVGDYFATVSSPTPDPNAIVTQCDWGPIANTLKGKDAKVEYVWRVVPQHKGAVAGRVSCTESDCGAIGEFKLGQWAGAFLRCRVTMRQGSTVNLVDQAFVGNRRFDTPLNTDMDPFTGDPALCGADYRVTFDLLYPGGSDPTVIASIERWNGFNWQLLAALPADVLLAPQVLDFKVVLSDIGSPSPFVGAWTVFSQNGFEAGTMPCIDPCEHPLVCELEQDNLCPYVVSVDDSELQSGNGAGALKIHFSEPMAPIGASDITISPPLPPTVTLAFSRSDHNRVLSIAASPAWPSGNWTLTLAPSITDAEGNPLSGEPDCGYPIPDVLFCTEESGVRLTNSSGQQITRAKYGEPVYVTGSGLPPSTPVAIYLSQDDGLTRGGSRLADWTDTGPELIVTDGSGNIPLTSLGVPVVIDEFGAVADLDLDGQLGPDDRFCLRCGVGLTVGPPCEDSPAPPVALWSMDQASGSVVGERASGLHGVQSGGTPVWTAGRVNGALGFDGVGSRVRVIGGSELWVDDGDFSISAWIQTSALSGTIVSHSDAAGGYTLRLGGAVPELTISDGAGSSVHVAAGAPNLADSQWHHVAATVERLSPTGITIYVDGVPVYTGDPRGQGGAMRPAADLRIGVRAGADFFRGYLDEVRLDDEALSAQDVAQLYEQPETGGCFEQFCAADFNSDGSLDTRDVLAFLNVWVVGSDEADFNEDGVVNTLDVLAFLNVWAAGC
ncbi:MAG TPA: LamG-like jellyroll fold domain-containing protein [Phycisphaerales bacterium]|nr:LamG-like jellyroll fold domain-containing protein [Phycisphaerales bacterium]